MSMRNIRGWLPRSLLVLLLAACQRTAQLPSIQANYLPPVPISISSNNFTHATPGRALTFPTDFGAHPNFQTEWWYYTGNLVSPDNARFGYQLTFFRRALLPQDETSPRRSAWATPQVYMAHFALTDKSNNLHHANQYFSRGSAGLAGAISSPFKVWLYDWKVEQTVPDQYHLSASQGDENIDLSLFDSKGPILNGVNGYSQKGPETGNASYYYSMTRLITKGTIQIGDQKYLVEGSSWMDHEFSTNALSDGQIGWDWFSVQFDNKSELMFYQIRRKDGSIDPFSSGTFVAADGSTRHLDRGAVRVTVTGTWKSPHNNSTYPSGWILSIPSEDLTLEITPLIKDQEMNLYYSYWEGAVDIRGEIKNISITGYGYVELTGYSGAITGQF